MKHRGTQILETDRLLLRRFSLADSTAMYRNWARDPAVTQYLTWHPHQSEEKTLSVLRQWCLQYGHRRFYEWAVVPKKLGEPIGSVDAMPVGWNGFEVGYCFGSLWWGQGFATEALQAVTEFLFEEVGCRRIEAKFAVENVASMRVLQKIGMHPGNSGEIFVRKDDGFFTCQMYEMKKNRFRERNE